MVCEQILGSIIGGHRKSLQARQDCLSLFANPLINQECQSANSLVTEAHTNVMFYKIIEKVNNVLI